jgi:heme-degrading monooxygenase HmoA
MNQVKQNQPNKYWNQIPNITKQTTKLIGILALLFTLNCTVAAPFKKSTQWDQKKVQSSTKVLVAYTEVKITGSIWDQRIFWNRVSDVRRSLDENQGYLGGSIRRELFGEYAWTMTVWTDEESLEEFIDSREHSRAMKEGDSAVGGGKFLRIWVDAESLPLPWEEAITKIRNEGRDL